MAGIKHVIFIIYLLSGINYAFGQNLVKNGDFEDCEYQDRKPSIETCNYIKPLYETTPDYHNSSYEGHFGTYLSLPQSGNGYVGLALKSENKSYVEYLGILLESPLEAHSIYEMSIFLKYSPNSSFAVDKLSIHFDSEIPKIKRSKYLKEGICLSIKDIYGMSDWTEKELTYKAKGGERYLIIGTTKNCLKEMSIEYLEPSFPSKSIPYAYILIDNISLTLKDSPRLSESNDFTNY